MKSICNNSTSCNVVIVPPSIFNGGVFYPSFSISMNHHTVTGVDADMTDFGVSALIFSCRCSEK